MEAYEVLNDKYPNYLEGMYHTANDIVGTIGASSNICYAVTGEQYTVWTRVWKIDEAQDKEEQLTGFLIKTEELWKKAIKGWCDFAQGVKQEGRARRLQDNTPCIYWRWLPELTKRVDSTYSIYVFEARLLVSCYPPITHKMTIRNTEFPLPKVVLKGTPTKGDTPVCN